METNLYAHHYVDFMHARIATAGSWNDWSGVKYLRVPGQAHPGDQAGCCHNRGFVGHGRMPCAPAASRQNGFTVKERRKKWLASGKKS